MRLSEQGVPRSGLASPALPSSEEDLSQTTINPLKSVIRFIDKTLVIAELEARKLRHDPTELITRAVQPALWLLVFGQVFTRVRAIPTGNMRVFSVSPVTARMGSWLLASPSQKARLSLSREGAVAVGRIGSK